MVFNKFFEYLRSHRIEYYYAVEDKFVNQVIIAFDGTHMEFSEVLSNYTSVDWGYITPNLIVCKVTDKHLLEDLLDWS